MKNISKEVHMEIDTILQICKEYEFWNKLNDENKNDIVKESKIEEYKKGKLIYSPTQKCKGIIRVIKGCCRIYILTEDGREITLYKIYEGDVCTLSASCMMNEVMFDTFMVAEEDTKLVLTNVFVLKKIMEKNIYVENYMYKMTISKFSELMWSMQDLLFTSLDNRLALFLIKEEEDKKVMLTHEKIAIQLGSSREVISRILKKFEKDNIITLARNEITILDLEK